MKRGAALPWVAVAALTGCGDAKMGPMPIDAMIPPPCGDNKKEPHEQCDDGNTTPGDGCSATCRDENFGDLTVTWELNSDKKGMDNPAVFSSDGCVDFAPATSGSTHVRVRATAGPEMRDATEGCGNGQITLGKLPIGNYTFEATFQWTDPAGSLMDLSKPKSFMVTIPAASAPPNPKVVFTNADFTTPPQGWLFFQTFFGSKTPPQKRCDAVTPAVAQQRLTMTPRSGGSPVTQRTATTNIPLDGSAGGPCVWPQGATDTQRVENLKSDLYSFRLEGLNGAGAVVYCSTSTVFVGAGRLNTAYELLAPAASTCAP